MNVKIVADTLVLKFDDIFFWGGGGWSKCVCSHIVLVFGKIVQVVYKGIGCLQCQRDWQILVLPFWSWVGVKIELELR